MTERDRHSRQHDDNNNMLTRRYFESNVRCQCQTYWKVSSTIKPEPIWLCCYGILCERSHMKANAIRHTMIVYVCARLRSSKTPMCADKMYGNVSNVLCCRFTPANMSWTMSANAYVCVYRICYIRQAEQTEEHYAYMSCYLLVYVCYGQRNGSGKGTEFTLDRVCGLCHVYIPPKMWQYLFAHPSRWPI